MYYKITITDGNVTEICEHLDSNGYTFEAIHCNLYVLEDEMDYVETILFDHGANYMVNDEYEVITTRRD